jgi:hypothetical protein
MWNRYWVRMPHATRTAQIADHALPGHYGG